MKIVAYVEGCLDKIVVGEMLRSILREEYEDNVDIRLYGGGKQGIFRRSKIDLLNNDIDATVLVVVDADEGIYITLNTARLIYGDQISIGSPIGSNVYPLRVNESTQGGILVWCTNTGEPTGCSGTIETVITEALSNAHGCTRDYSGIPNVLGCKSASCSRNYARVAEKLGVIVALAACSGKGTLALAGGKDARESRCGLELSKPIRGILGESPLREIRDQLAHLLRLL